MLKIREVIIVEGRYDKNKVLQAVDATVIETGGFGIFRDSEKRRYLKLLAERRGLIIMTDPDGAGFVIRSFLRGCVEPRYVKNAYVPEVFGKERRKRSPSKEGKLGVEGMDSAIIVEALRRAGACFEGEQADGKHAGLTKADLYSLGLSGGEKSTERRAVLQKELGLPSRLTANGLLEALNVLLTGKEELLGILASVEEKGTENE